MFIRGEYREVITDSLKYCHTNKGLQIHAYCIMTSHVHLILSTEEDNKLSDVIRDFKSFTSTKRKNCIKENSAESRREWLIWMLKGPVKRIKEILVFNLPIAIHSR
ncbi:transposase [Fulvivirga kasyanovii]|uniref:transposase n=1 Tax=Fulvivirga kasyanovii TaxID=396812 RepID=UPI003CD05FE3